MKQSIQRQVEQITNLYHLVARISIHKPEKSREILTIMTKTRINEFVVFVLVVIICRDDIEHCLQIRDQIPIDARK